MFAREGEGQKPRLSVAVFAYNEEENIEAFFEELLGWAYPRNPRVPSVEIIFVDDGSKDRSLERAASMLRGHLHQILRHPKRMGIGAAIKSAVQVARGEWFTFLPADGQVPPVALELLWDAVQSHGVDLGLSVYERRDDGLHRALLSRGVRNLIEWTFGLRLQSDGPYLLRKDLLDWRSLEPNSFFLNFEVPIRLLKKKTPYVITRVPCRPRRRGRSKTSNIQTIAQVCADLWRLKLKMMMNENDDKKMTR
ncbi:MAG: glycosyltransferase family 2 protein [Sandaracinaceae bacterium]|nr:glycosyltransferase family 2 protein [Sandaracinaceae bacterium]